MPVCDRPVRIADIDALSPTLRRFRLVPDTGQLLPPASPGAHILVAMDTGEGERINAYSLIATPESAGAYEIVVRHASGSRGGSDFLHAAKVGQVLAVSRPQNMFAPFSRASRHLLFSAGIGITPFLFYARTFLADADWHLDHVCRPDERHAFERLLDGIDPAHWTIHENRAALDMASRLAATGLGAHIYACGPSAFLSDIVRTAEAAGLSAGRVHVERFTPADGAPFEVMLGRSGRRLAVSATRSLLDTLEEAGLDIPNLCRGGVCGACRVEVLDGEPDHRDHVLDIDEREGGKVMLACISRARTPCLTLDL